MVNSAQLQVIEQTPPRVTPGHGWWTLGPQPWDTQGSITSLLAGAWMYERMFVIIATS